MKKTYTEKEVATALQILLDLSDIYYDPDSEHNDRSAMINDVASILDEKRFTLTSGDVRIIEVFKATSGYMVTVEKSGVTRDVCCIFDSHGQLKVLTRDKRVREFLIENQEEIKREA